MMKVRDVFEQIRQIQIHEKGQPVERIIAEEFLKLFKINAPIQPVTSSHIRSEEGVFNIAVVDEILKPLLSGQGIEPPSDKEWVLFGIDENQCCWLLSSKPYFLYASFSYIMEDILEKDAGSLKHWMREMSFAVEKSTFDIFLTQYARLIRRFKREEYIRECARLGFTHIEVNALATPFPIEQGVSGEFYSDFYTYAPALDQFVSSRLNQGIYPKDYLKANLNLLKENARLALQYGLVPGLLCFEPRSVPESLFQRYPTLRGARVDHPFRSFKPRFNLSIVHPVVQRHYEELISNLLREVPELEFLTIWTNDSGAGFEHTKSLYVGRNGGAYLVREWKDDREIAKAASANIIHFFKFIRDAASRINPRFRVVTRLEPFYGEREYLWSELRDRIDVEINSLLTSGWENNYPHPQYPDVKVLGSAYHNTLLEEEKEPMEELRSQKSQSFFYHSMGAHTNHEPLLGIPFPWLTHEKLLALSRQGIATLAHLGGIQPPDKVPYAVNQEVFRAFQFDSRIDIDKTVLTIARKYAGDDYAQNLVNGWQLVEQAIRYFIPLPLYSHYGVVWQRLLVRPLVPDISRIPENERAYYEKFMCSSIHNPNKVDLATDVLFELVSKDYAQKAFVRIDDNVREPLHSAIDLFKAKMDDSRRSNNDQAFKLFEDQFYRIRALGCLFETLRNTSVWIYSVHEYLDATDRSIKADCRKLLDEMIGREIQNSQELIELCEQAPVEWMIISGSEETPFIHGENFPKLLEKKIILMEKYKSSEPYIDPDYMFRVANNPYEAI
jgi:hypothetical protein